MNNEIFARAKSISVYDILKGRIDLSPKRDNARWYAGPCPECGGIDRFWIDTRKNTCGCHKCDFGGDAVGAWSQLRHISGIEAAKELLGEADTPSDWKPKIVQFTPKPVEELWKSPKWIEQANWIMENSPLCSLDNLGGCQGDLAIRQAATTPAAADRAVGRVDNQRSLRLPG